MPLFVKPIGKSESARCEIADPIAVSYSAGETTQSTDSGVTTDTAPHVVVTVESHEVVEGFGTEGVAETTPAISIVAHGVSVSCGARHVAGPVALRATMRTATATYRYLAEDAVTYANEWVKNSADGSSGEIAQIPQIGFDTGGGWLVNRYNYARVLYVSIVGHGGNGGGPGSDAGGNVLGCPGASGSTNYTCKSFVGGSGGYGGHGYYYPSDKNVNVVLWDLTGHMANRLQVIWEGMARGSSLRLIVRRTSDLGWITSASAAPGGNGNVGGNATSNCNCASDTGSNGSNGSNGTGATPDVNFENVWFGTSTYGNGGAPGGLGNMGAVRLRIEYQYIRRYDATGNANSVG